MTNSNPGTMAIDNSMKQNPLKMAYKRLGYTNLGGGEVQVKGYASDFIIDYEQLVTPTAKHAVPAKFIISLH